jgi:hypothetical protein
MLFSKRSHERGHHHILISGGEHDELRVLRVSVDVQDLIDGRNGELHGPCAERRGLHAQKQDRRSKKPAKHSTTYARAPRATFAGGREQRKRGGKMASEGDAA